MISKARMAATVSAATLAVALGAAVAPARAAEPPEPARLMPVDGTSWQPGAGLADTVPDGQQGLAFTVYNVSTNPLVLAQRALLAALDLGPDSGSEYDAAVFTGLQGQPTGNLQGLSYAINNPAGIEPCWDIGYIDTAGVARTMHVDPSTRSDFVTPAPPSAPASGWTTYGFSLHLPPGTLTSLTLGADVTTEPPEPARVAFDRILVNGNSWTSASAFGLTEPPEPD